PERALVYVHRWAEDENEWVRRLASEGTRPRLPWAMNLPKFQADPEPVLAVLEKLKADESETVRRSVANNLNDISKDHPERMLAVCESWYGQSAPTNRIVKHACRSLLKAGHPRALRLFGFASPDKVSVANLQVTPYALAIGDELSFSFDLEVAGEEPVQVRLEYAIDFVKARGQTSRKVFMIFEKSLPPGRSLFEKKHSLIERTTRKHYPGLHRLTILANGEPQAQAEFDLQSAAAEA
ncbi:MAG TPA: DNA alkylation repair protein, partial [Anaerolineales bacterium]|nr:DNA alkylation repair protein [Anaerolineales bacterium]